MQCHPANWLAAMSFGTFGMCHLVTGAFNSDVGSAVYGLGWTMIAGAR
jgi:hypothetical protein